MEISFFPDVVVEGTVARGKATGAVKLYLKKKATSVGSMLAALIYFHRSQVVGDAMAAPQLCGVTDVQANVVHTATGNYQRLLQQAQQVCHVVAATWPTI